MSAEALGHSQGGVSIKIHLRAEGKGKPLTILITAGQQHEQTVFEALMEQGAVKRPGRGPRIRPKRVVGDKEYSSTHMRRYLRKRGIGVVIPHRKDEHTARPATLCGREPDGGQRVGQRPLGTYSAD
jgi:hypothetical protein